MIAVRDRIVPGLVLLFCLFALPGISFAADEVSFNSLRTATPFMRDLDTLYRKGMDRELLRSYPDALFAYNVILTRTQIALNRSTTMDKEAILRVVPYAIAAAYRKSIATRRYIEGCVVKLNEQLKLYEDSEKWINEILTQISNLNLEQQYNIPPEQYGMLYYARAYGRAGWAYALLNGNYWKRYLIYTPSDTVAMMDRAVDDLNQMSKIYEVKKPGGFFSIVMGKAAEARINGRETSDSELLTYSLCYNETKLESIKKVMGRQLENSVAKTIDLYNSRDMQARLKKGKEIYTYEDFMKPETRDVIRAMADLINEMGTN